jgi:hypothetical protein
MNRLRLLAAGLALACGLPLLALQAAPPSHMPSVDEHVKVLSEKLSLTADQQEKARPIIAQMQDGLQKVTDDKSLTPEESHEQLHAVFMKADKELRAFLSDEQKTKLDEMERQHFDTHPQQ